jgi:ABC-type transport system involved in cytochrome c biogenesis ATPase subunit
MGKNGAGKSTLLKMVAGQVVPDGGSVRLGASLKMGYFAQQSLDLLDPDLTVEEQLRNDFPHESIGALRNLAGAFQFSGDDVDKKIRALSGGEKTRLVLARMLLDPPNSWCSTSRPTISISKPGDAARLAQAIRRDDAVCVARPSVSARPEQSRAGIGRRERNRGAAASVSGLVCRICRANRPRSPGVHT